jgi:hypothetical protein
VPIYIGTAGARWTWCGEAVHGGRQKRIGGEGRRATCLRHGATPWTHTRVTCSEGERDSTVAWPPAGCSTEGKDGAASMGSRGRARARACSCLRAAWPLWHASFDAQFHPRERARWPPWPCHADVHGGHWGCAACVCERKGTGNGLGEVEGCSDSL